MSTRTPRKNYHDLEGDVASGVLRQLGELGQSIADALRDVEHLVCVASGKGGVGKSTLTIGLAHALLARGRRVAVLDADFNGPSQAQMAGLTGAPWIPGPRGLEMPRSPSGLPVLSVGGLLAEAEPTEFDSVAADEGHVWRATREFAFLRQILSGVAWGSLDVLLLDLPPGAERTVHFAQALGPETRFVVATVPSDLARGVVGRSLTALAARGGEVLGVVENMAGYWCAECREVRPLFPESTRPLDAPLLGRLPFDPELARLCDRGWTLDGFRALGTAEAWEDVADALVERLEENR